MPPPYLAASHAASTRTAKIKALAVAMLLQLQDERECGASAHLWG